MPYLLLVIIHNLYVSHLTLFPLEADSILIVDTDTVLTFSISMQRLGFAVAK